MKRYDIAICNCPLGPHLEVHDYEGGQHADADEAIEEIAKLRELLRALVGYVRDRNEDFCDLRNRPCRDCSDGVLCPYHAAKAALRGEE